MSSKKIQLRGRKVEAGGRDLITTRKVNALVTALLGWFAESARDLPWRRTRDPYAIWVSEIMLQQTQVKTVIPYWERWMGALPAIKDLAEAKAETIHKLWEGLGYYTRVRNMQKGAKEIVAKHGGTFPREYEAILELPGIGRYTAGAISSIAFNEAKAILDGNVVRVLTRVFGIAENPREKLTNAKLWRLAEELVVAAQQVDQNIHERSCSHLNQALMELGALVCTPRQPKCLLCPVRGHCVAYETGRVEELPNLGVRATATARRFVAFVVELRGRYLVRQRAAGVVNGHLWEFPNVEMVAGVVDLKAIAKAELGMVATGVEELCAIKHTITRYRITLEVYRVTAKAGGGKNAAGLCWLRLEELEALAFASAHRAVLKRLGSAISAKQIKTFTKFGKA
ncbi:MAG: A/G-specific adenine glycosylase [Pedosphaera sp.]|nr:A/G-specific adenine glycosylase [Pedosphaera sp.]